MAREETSRAARPARRVLAALSPRARALALAALALTTAACRRTNEVDPVSEGADAPPVPGGMRDGRLSNRFAYIPPQCYTTTRDREGGAVHNPCYACHLRPTAPNFVDDSELQLAYAMPPGAAENRWHNLFAPPTSTLGAPGQREDSDDQVLARVRRGNYFTASGEIALARRLRALPAAWDGQGDRRWDGFVPDAWFHFDERGFDRAADGTATGWRAFAYTPFLGGFMPTNGSMDDVLIRLDPSLRQDAGGRWDQRIYELNLAVVEALIRRADVAIDPVDERAAGADLDLDGRLGVATRVAFRAPAPAPVPAREKAPAPPGQPTMHFLGRARSLQDHGMLSLEPGLFPLGTEFLHSVRYLDVGADGAVVMAPRMKELRYMKKVRWFSPADLRAHAAADTIEQAESPDGAIEFVWEFDRGIYNGQGWLLQGFIEAANGSLRPQGFEESVFCVGCHGEIGATTDSIFAFARKLDAQAPARGWFHFTQHGLRGLPEPRRRDGQFEYSFYLTNNGGGDDLRENREVQERFFGAGAAPREEALAQLHGDIGTLLLPSAARAIALDRAYGAIVRAQTFTAGRDAVLAPSSHVRKRVDVNEKTGVEKALPGPDDAHTRDDDRDAKPVREAKPMITGRLGG